MEKGGERLWGKGVGLVLPWGFDATQIKLDELVVILVLPNN
jgi:hypothetical protein